MKRKALTTPPRPALHFGVYGRFDCLWFKMLCRQLHSSA